MCPIVNDMITVYVEFLVYIINTLDKFQNPDVHVLVRAKTSPSEYSNSTGLL
jgi:hypothetical protein